MTITRRSQTKLAQPILGVLGVLAMSALVATVGCSGNTVPGVQAQSALPATTATQPGEPVVVSCEPNQRTLVRPVVINGATVSQVECITTAPGPVPAVFAAPGVTTYREAVPAQRVAYRADDLGDARVLAVPPATVTRPVPARQVVYSDDRPVRRTRSVKKSAIIIGSSAGAGAGVGAAVGGKKGALIGAAIGGGGAALWDQITRRDR
jgi:hypothetical protein